MPGRPLSTDDQESSDSAYDLDYTDDGHRTSEERSTAGIEERVVLNGSRPNNEVGVSGTSALMDAGRHHSDPESHQMNVIVQPPLDVRCGDVLSPPISVSLQIGDGPTAREGDSKDTSRYWAVASLVSTDGLTALAPPSTSLLTGTVADSVHEARLTHDERAVGYFRYGNLMINQPGDYRLRFSLMQMPTTNGTSEGPHHQSTENRNISTVLTQVFRVYENA
ncbi:MAG: hypothetical protein Q9220_006649 [cf. Caloplaca sp. 1 TL-2023]